MKNEYKIRGDITAIIINSPKHGRVETLISTDKLQLVDSFTGTWYVNFDSHTKSFYVQGDMPRVNGKRSSAQLHRWITNATKGLVVDHINHDTLDNSSGNLRVVTIGENNQNLKGIRKNNKSGVRGVHYCERNDKYRAAIRVNKKVIHIGYFTRLEDAEKAVIEARKTSMPFSEELGA